MNEFWQVLGHNLAQHLSSIGVGVGVLFVAFVTTMPALMPASLQEYWTWARDALQVAIPARFHPKPDPSQPPANPAKE